MPSSPASPRFAGAELAAAAPRRRLRQRFALLVGVSVLLWLLVMLVAGDSGVLALGRARAKLLVLEDEARRREDENERLKGVIKSLESDDREVERIAREELMMARPDEEVILVPDLEGQGERTASR